MSNSETLHYKLKRMLPQCLFRPFRGPVGDSKNSDQPPLLYYSLGQQELRSSALAGTVNHLGIGMAGYPFGMLCGRVESQLPWIRRADPKLNTRRSLHGTCSVTQSKPPRPLSSSHRRVLVEFAESYHRRSCRRVPGGLDDWSSGSGRQSARHRVGCVRPASYWKRECCAGSTHHPRPLKLRPGQGYRGRTGRPAVGLSPDGLVESRAQLRALVLCSDFHCPGKRYRELEGPLVE